MYTIYVNVLCFWQYDDLDCIPNALLDSDLDLKVRKIGRSNRFLKIFFIQFRVAAYVKFIPVGSKLGLGN